ncbi:MAG TPA: polysaccharide ABC transporter ATP-binding protein [Chitinophagales bacterium]|nr:polysaccharide ABC transporter ATP-binding protein [Chitinophagales bacterium]HRP38765.1 polysaccharide ABC transporter ATP-binding protein [Chitinophagales bacterium]
MSDIVLKVENLSKLYRLGEVGTGTISHDLNRWWAKVRGKEDPYALVGQVNDRSQKAESDYVWSLRDINFEVKQGEVLGVIGKNGAGKSTLLKLISQITSPTTGSIKAKGRIASLLEVGTGMNPELTARENIYLNGAILGMTKKEISSKFDEIVDFSGCTMYVDTPVKRFSSGMRVRLGFAVAAFLEPEILIVDEVLAVGDAEFQKKAIGKMKDISSGGGRTVLFVSHNMLAVKSLCTRLLWLDHGQSKSIGDVDEIISSYLSNQQQQNCSFVSINKEFEGFIVHSIRISDNGIDGMFNIDEQLVLEVEVSSNNYFKTININLFFKTAEGAIIFATCSPKQEFTQGKYSYVCTIPSGTLNDNMYNIDLMVVDYGPKVLHNLQDIITIEGVEPKRANSAWLSKFPGLIKPTYFKWHKNEIHE